MQPRILLAVAKEQDGKIQEAIEAWHALLAKAAADAPWRKTVEQRLAQDEARLAGKSPEPSPETAPQGQGGPNAEDVAAAKRMSPAERQAMIENMVQGLAAKLDANGDDLAGWLKLVRAYSVLNRKQDALAALAKAKTSFTGNTDALNQLDQLAAELGLKS